MFGLFGGLFKNRVARRRDRQRAIFRYWDGTRERGADPAVVYRAFVSHPTFNWETHPVLIDTGDKEALTITLGAIREVFGVAAWSEDGHGNSSGLTDWETIDLLIQFNHYIGGLKKSTSPTLTSPPPTVQPSSVETSNNTNALSDSGSTPGELKTAAASP